MHKNSYFIPPIPSITANYPSYNELFLISIGKQMRPFGYSTFNSPQIEVEPKKAYISEEPRESHEEIGINTEERSKLAEEGRYSTHELLLKNPITEDEIHRAIVMGTSINALVPRYKLKEMIRIRTDQIASGNIEIEERDKENKNSYHINARIHQWEKDIEILNENYKSSYLPSTDPYERIMEQNEEKALAIKEVSERQEELQYLNEQIHDYEHQTSIATTRRDEAHARFMTLREAYDSIKKDRDDSHSLVREINDVWIQETSMVKHLEEERDKILQEQERLRKDTRAANETSKRLEQLHRDALTNQAKLNSENVRLSGVTTKMEIEIDRLGKLKIEKDIAFEEVTKQLKEQDKLKAEAEHRVDLLIENTQRLVQQHTQTQLKFEALEKQTKSDISHLEERHRTLKLTSSLTKSQLNTQIKEMIDKFDGLQKELHVKNIEIEDRQKALNKQRKQIQSLHISSEQERERYQEHDKEVQKSIDSMRETLTNKEGQLKEIRQRIDDLESEKSKLFSIENIGFKYKQNKEKREHTQRVKLIKEQQKWQQNIDTGEAAGTFHLERFDVDEHGKRIKRPRTDENTKVRHFTNLESIVGKIEHIIKHDLAEKDKNRLKNYIANVRAYTRGEKASYGELTFRIGKKKPGPEQRPLLVVHEATINLLKAPSTLDVPLSETSTTMSEELEEAEKLRESLGKPRLRRPKMTKEQRKEASELRELRREQRISERLIPQREKKQRE